MNDLEDDGVRVVPGGKLSAGSGAIAMAAAMVAAVDFGWVGAIVQPASSAAEVNAVMLADP